MAKKKERVILEDVELKPQVIGYTYQKKSNLGRVIFTFAIFILVVYYINDISVFFNKLIGKDSAETIENLSRNTEEKEPEKVEDAQEIVYYVFDYTLSFGSDDYNISNFNKTDNILSFDITNIKESTLDYNDRLFFIETYTENKTLLERRKVNITSINPGAKISYEIEINNDFYYIAFVEKTTADYPAVNLQSDETGSASVACTKGIETIVYTFRNSKLEGLKHTISNSNVADANYYSGFNAYQTKVASYNQLDGITATFNGNLNGYTAVISIDLKNADLSTIDEKYYYAYNEEAKVVKFEMQTYGFACN